MNDGLAAVTVSIFLLDYGRPVARLALLDDGCTIPIAITILMRLADRNASSDRAHSNANLVRKSRRSDRAHYGGSK